MPDDHSPKDHNVAETCDQVLTRLAGEIRLCVNTSTEAAIRAGTKLREAKALLKHGEWLPWLHERVEMTERVAQYHMQLAASPNPKRVSDLPIRAALKVVREDKKAKALARQTISLLTHKGGEVPYPLPTGPAQFNITNEHIGWAGFSWNVITGCLHGCPYCYAREIALSPSMRAHFPAGFDPVFHPERLAAPGNTKFPADAATEPRLRRCFVCSMADLFGHWVPREWIEQVLQACVVNPRWVYMFLTKFPSRYLEFMDQMPPQAWLGTSVDDQKRVRFAEDAFRAIGDRCVVKYPVVGAVSKGRPEIHRPIDVRPRHRRRANRNSTAQWHCAGICTAVRAGRPHRRASPRGWLRRLAESEFAGHNQSTIPRHDFAARGTLSRHLRGTAN